MSSLVFPLPASAPTASNAASASTSPAARGRDAQDDGGADSFGAALARTRESRARQAEDRAEAGAAGTPASRRRTLSAVDQQDGKKETSPAELLAMALLTPAFNAQAAQQRHAAAQGGDSPLRAATDRGKATASEQSVADAAAAATGADALPTGEAVASAGVHGGAQAAKALADAKDADTEALRAKAKPATSADDVKGTTAAAPAAVAAPPALPSPHAASGGSQASEKPASGAAPAAASAAGSRNTPEPAALAAQSKEPALPDPAEGNTDAPAISPAALNFKTALAEATGASSTAQAEQVPRYAVATPVGSEHWGADIGSQMVRMGTDGHHVAELSLNPAGLGPLKVTLTLGDSQAQAQFVSAHESVRRAVEAALPQLRDTLAGQGIQLGQASVNAGTQQQQQQSFAQQQERALDAPARPAPREPQGIAEAVGRPGRSAGGSRSAIDTFA